MIHNILGKIGIMIVGLLTTLGMYQTPIQTSEINLGSQLAVGGETYYLSGSGVSSTDTTITLTKFGYTNPDGTWQDFSMPNFGNLGCGTFEPGNMKGKQEFISFTGVTQNSDNTTQLTGVSRGLERFSPYAASTTLQTSHAGSTKFVVSNSPPCFYENYMTINNDETVASVKTFDIGYPPRYSSVPTQHSSGTYASSTAEFASFALVNAIAVSGASNADFSTKGLVELATGLEVASSTATGSTGANLCLPSSMATTTPGNNATSTIVVSQYNGKIHQSFLDLTQNYDFSSTSNATLLSTNATTTSFAAIGDAIRLGDLTYTLPSAQGAASSTLMNNGSGVLKWGNPYLIAEPSETLQVSGNTERQTNQVHTDSVAGTRMKQAQVYYAGKVRVKFDFETEITDPAVTATTWIITNNTATSTYDSATYDFATTTHVAYFSTHTADINVSEGSIIEVWAKTSATGRYTAVKNFRIYFDLIAATTTARISIN